MADSTNTGNCISFSRTKILLFPIFIFCLWIDFQHEKKQEIHLFDYVYKMYTNTWHDTHIIRKCVRVHVNKFKLNERNKFNESFNRRIIALYQHLQTLASTTILYFTNNVTLTHFTYIPYSKYPFCNWQSIWNHSPCDTCSYWSVADMLNMRWIIFLENLNLLINHLRIELEYFEM